MKKNIYSTTDKIIIFFALLCFTILSLLFISTMINKYKRIKLIEQGIYEIDKTYNTEDDRISAYYMICEPVSEYGELKLTVQDFIVKNDIIQSLKNRTPSDDYSYVSINFISPSEHFSAGWNDGMGYDFITCNIGNHVIMEVFVFYDDKTDIEHWRYSANNTCKTAATTVRGTTTIVALRLNGLNINNSSLLARLRK